MRDYKVLRSNNPATLERLLKEFSSQAIEENKSHEISNFTVTFDSSQQKLVYAVLVSAWWG